MESILGGRGTQHREREGSQRLYSIAYHINKAYYGNQYVSQDVMTVLITKEDITKPTSSGGKLSSSQTITK